MASWGVLEAGGVWLAMWPYGCDTRAAALFQDAEVIESWFDNELTGRPGDDSVYQSTARTIRQRLQLVGVASLDATVSVFEAWARASETDPELVSSLDDLWLAYRAEGSRDTAGAHTLALTQAIPEIDCDWPLILRFFVDRMGDEETVTLNLASVWTTGESDDFPRTPDFCDSARHELRNDVAASLPTIVLTEGSSDARILEAALEIVRPDLRGFVTFLDYAGGAPGGVDSVVKGARALAAAGVANPVVALLDNDTAGRIGMHQLQGSALPSRMRAIQLPTLPLAQRYPTLGTEGLVAKDINGLAVSIELFLGLDVLRDADGSLPPVQLSVWNPKVEAFQGEVAHKRQIQQRFWAKVERARGGDVNLHEWSDLAGLLDHLVET